jgi:hypothetical protein
VISPNNTQLQEQKKETELARQNQNKFGLEQMARNEQSRQASATASVASTMASPRNVHHQSEQQQLSMQLQETCNELRKERESHEQSKIALQEQKKETEEARQSQKKIGIELNNIKAQQQRRYQVTDNELANLARQLRYQVSNIAHVHFKDEIEITDESIHDLWQLLTKNLPNFLLSREFFSRCMLDSASRPLIVNAILWNFLVHKIMGKLYWAGADASEGWTRLAGALSMFQPLLTLVGSY